MKHITKHIAAQYLIGIIFLISSVSKAINFPNTASIFRKYFQAYSIDLTPILYDILGAILIGIELVISLFLLFGILRKITINFTIIILFFFTCITLFIAIDGELSDCGCFGEQLPFTGWQSFAKNIILLVITFVSKQREDKRNDKNSIWAIPVFFGVACFCFLGLKGQPFYESGKFKTGVNVCIFPEDISQPFFSIEQLQINKNGKTYTNITDSLFYQNKIIVIGIIRNYNEVSPSDKKKLAHSVLNICNKTDGSPILLTSFTENNLGIEIPIPIGKSDDSLLEKIISSNIGIIVVNKCLIIGKWQRNSLGLQEYPKSMSDILNDKSK